MRRGGAGASPKGPTPPGARGNTDEAAWDAVSATVEAWRACRRPHKGHSWLLASCQLSSWPPAAPVAGGAHLRPVPLCPFWFAMMLKDLFEA